MPPVTAKIDLGQVPAQIEQFNNLIRSSGSVVGDFATKVTTYNEQGKIATQTIEQMSAAGQKLTTTFKDVGGAVELMGSKATTSIKTVNDQLSLLATQAGKFGGDQARNLFPLPDGASIARISSYNSAINNLQQTIGQSGASAQTVAQMFQQLQAGPAAFAQSLATLPPQLQAVGQAMLGVAGQAQQAANTGAQAGQSFAISWQGLVRIFEAQVFKRAISAVIDAVSTGIKAAVDYQVQLQQVANVTQQTGPKFDGFAAQVRNLSDQFAVPISEVLAASQIALTSQLGNTANGFEVLTAAMRLSQATGASLEGTVRAVTGTMQAFQLSADKASSVTNTLYTVSQRTRVSIDEISNAVGRTSQTARALGVSEQQVGALFATISQQGGRPVEAMSLLNTALGKILAPSKALTQTINQLGFATPQAAVQVLGLTGFLDQLSVAIERNPQALAELGGGLRGIRAELALTGNATRIYAENLDAIKNSADTAAAAALRVAHTSGQQIKQEFNEIQNIFTQDIGSGIINGITGVVNAMGGAKPTIAGFVEVIKGVGLAYAALRLSFAAGLGPVGIAIAAAVGAYSFFAARVAVLEASNAEAIKKTIAAIRERTAALNESSNRGYDALRDRGTALVDANFAPRVEASRQAIQLAQEVRDAAIEGHRLELVAFHATNEAVLDGYRQRITELRKIQSDSTAQQESGRKFAEDFAQSTDARRFEREVRLNTDPQRQIDLSSQRRDQLNNRATATFQNPNATNAQIEAAQRMFQEAARLSDQMEKQEAILQRQRAIQTGQYQQVNQNGQLVNQIIINTQAAHDREEQDIARVNAAEEAHNKVLQARADLARQEQAVQTNNLRVAEAATRQVEQFNALTASGNLKAQYANASDPLVAIRNSYQRTMNAALDLIATQLNLTRNANGQLTGTAAAVASYNALAESYRRRGQAVIEEAAATQSFQAAERQGVRVANDRSAAERNLGQAFTDRQAAEAAVRNNAAQAAVGARAIADSLSGPGRTDSNLGGQAVARLTTPPASDEQIKTIREEYEKFYKALRDTAAAQRELERGITPERVAALAAATNAAADAQARLNRFSDRQLGYSGLTGLPNTPGGPVNLLNPNAPAEGQIGIIRNRDAVNNIAESGRNAQTAAQQSLPAAITNLTETLRRSNDQRTQLGNDVAASINAALTGPGSPGLRVAEGDIATFRSLTTAISTASTRIIDDRRARDAELANLPVPATQRERVGGVAPTSITTSQPVIINPGAAVIINGGVQTGGPRPSGLPVNGPVTLPPSQVPLPQVQPRQQSDLGAPQVDDLGNAVRENGRQVASLAPALGENDDATRLNTDATESLGQTFANLMAALSAQQPTPQAQAGGGDPFGNPQNAWTGGMIKRFAKGGPVGTDTIPAWLSPGEFVVNAHSTNKFYSQLLAMNSGHQPRYLSKGGPVTVGDIHVSVNGGQHNERTIREIGIGISREIRRGTINFATS